jgi:hypothetical protein
MIIVYIFGCILFYGTEIKNTELVKTNSKSLMLYLFQNSIVLRNNNKDSNRFPGLTLLLERQPKIDF